MGYVEGAKVGYINNRDNSLLDNKHPNGSQNNSVLLPDLKTITPSITNAKHNYSVVNNGSYSNSNSIANLMNRKKSYEKMIKIDNQTYQLYKR